MTHARFAHGCPPLHAAHAQRRSPLGFSLGWLSLLAALGATNGAHAGTPDARQAMRTVLGLQPCQPSGKGKDYQVGQGQGRLASLDLVPWEKLAAGDTVRIHYRDAPYAGKFMLSARGTGQAPVRVCGIPGADGKRPVVTGRDAVTRKGQSYGHALHQSRSVIVIKPAASAGWEAYPQHIQIDGLDIRSAHPSYQFTDSDGARRRYDEFGACIWVERGHGITIADNAISDCSQAIFTKSTDDGAFAQTRDIRIAGNRMYNNGIVGNNRLHTTYVQSIDVVYEFNHYGPLRAGARGNSIKDRSIGTVVRYNRIEDGARALDLVEAEDFPQTAKATPAYRSTYVYGNQIIKDGRKGSVIHYGGDHNGSSPGEDWGEPNNRKGTLYFYHNTVRVTGNGYAAMFQLSTTEERADVRNNIFIFDATTQNPIMRASTDVGDAWTAGGIITFGRNWITRGWRDTQPNSKVGGALQGRENLVMDGIMPVAPTTLRPLAGTAAIDAAQPNAPATRSHPVRYQLDTRSVPVARPVKGSAPDLGAIEF
ncbi:hypothetical protein [Pseudoxanthomonas sp. PXM01]|uniref:hypothetical protein n=1 Tax=Pseudoxanthomonas sp. PXM01 TaxID=2769295 RepID=UPI00177DFF21|nr:hypothetical protein [Pseudoxanthomonas sp. PXM01]MBD9468356.1 hypothetical protein [Pseudoxanthomonas sp. PXM01]